MKLVKEVIIVLAFLALYGPLSLALWYESGKQQDLSLVVIFLIGAVLVVIYLIASIIISVVKRRQRASLLESYIPETRIRLKSLEEIEVENEEEDENVMVGFRALFDKTNGGDAV